MSNTDVHSFRNTQTCITKVLFAGTLVVSICMIVFGLRLGDFLVETTSLIGAGILLATFGIAYQWKRFSLIGICITGDKLEIKNRFCKNQEYLLHKDLSEVHKFRDDSTGLDLLIFCNKNSSFRLVIKWFDKPDELLELLYSKIPSLRNND